MSVSAAMHEDVEKRTGQQKEHRQVAEQMRGVLHGEIEESNRKEGQENEFVPLQRWFALQWL
jgi:hypothetical protein